MFLVWNDMQPTLRNRVSAHTMRHTFNAAKNIFTFSIKQYHFVLTLAQITLCNMEGLIVLNKVFGYEET